MRGPRFCFSVHSVISVRQVKFPCIMRSFRFRFPSAVLLRSDCSDGCGQLRTRYARFTHGFARRSAPCDCRRFSFSFAPALSVSVRRSGKRLRTAQRLDTLQRSAFYALREGRDTTRKQNRSQGVLAALACMCGNCTHSTRRIFGASKVGGAYAPRCMRKALSRAAAAKNGGGEQAARKKGGRRKPGPRKREPGNRFQISRTRRRRFGFRSGFSFAPAPARRSSWS